MRGRIGTWHQDKTTYYNTCPTNSFLGVIPGPIFGGSATLTTKGFDPPNDKFPCSASHAISTDDQLVNKTIAL
jgi:hypothetical protein